MDIDLQESKRSSVPTMNVELVEQPAGESRPIQTGFRGLLFWAKLTSFWFGYNLVGTAMGSVLWPAQIEALVGNAQKAFYSGLVPSLGAIAALVVAPIAGALSDITESKFGPRRPYILSGAVVTLVFMILMGIFNENTGGIWIFAVFLILYNVGQNWAGGAFVGLLPDIANPSQIGTGSAALGLGSVAGKLVGTLAVGFLSGNAANYWPPYIVLAVLYAIFLIPTLFVNEQVKSFKIEKVKVGDFCKSFFLPPNQKYKNFYLVILTRAFQEMGVYEVTPFLLYFLQDVVQVSNPSLMSSLCIATIVLASVPSSIIAGPLSDRYGRKIIVYISCAIQSIMMAGFVVMATYPNLPAIFIMCILFGFGYGAYESVDWALALDVVPASENVAKDMGLWHVALVLPDVISPFIGGVVLTAGQTVSNQVGYTAIFAVATLWFLMSGVFVYFVKVEKKQNYRFAE